MKQTINLHDFRNAFKQAGRENQFSYEGLEVLYNYLTQFEDDTGQELELDIIALCCEFAESSPKQISNDYNIALYGWENEEELANEVLEVLYDHTSVAGVCPNGDIVFTQF